MNEIILAAVKATAKKYMSLKDAQKMEQFDNFCELMFQLKREADKARKCHCVRVTPQMENIDVK